MIFCGINLKRKDVHGSEMKMPSDNTLQVYIVMLQR